MVRFDATTHSSSRKGPAHTEIRTSPETSLLATVVGDGLWLCFAVWLLIWEGLMMRSCWTSHDIGMLCSKALGVQQAKGEKRSWGV